MVGCSALGPLFASLETQADHVLPILVSSYCVCVADCQVCQRAGRLLVTLHGSETRRL